MQRWGDRGGGGSRLVRCSGEVEVKTGGKTTWYGDWGGLGDDEQW